MAHAIWHIEPSFIGKYWKDKLMGGAMAAQENVMNPLLDRVVGTAPGIPARPWFGGESSGGQPDRGFVTKKQAREATQNEMGFLSSLLGSSQKATPTTPSMNLATTPADPAFVRMMQKGRQLEPGGVNTSRTSVPLRSVSPAASTARGYLPINTLPRVKHSAPAALGPGGLPADVRHTGAHTQHRPPTGRVRGPAGPTGNIGKLPKGPMKEQMKEAATPATEDDKLRRMLKMMFLSDLIKGTEAPNPDYYAAVSVGPASRAFSPLPSMFRGR